MTPEIWFMAVLVTTPGEPPVVVCPTVEWPGCVYCLYAGKLQDYQSHGTLSAACYKADKPDRCTK